MGALLLAPVSTYRPLTRVQSQKEIVGEIKEAEPEVVVDEAYPPLIEAATGCVHRIKQSALRV